MFYDHLPTSTLLTLAIPNLADRKQPGALAAFIFNESTSPASFINVWSAPGNYQPFMPTEATCALYSSCQYLASSVRIQVAVNQCRFVCVTIHSAAALPSDITISLNITNETECSGHRSIWINQRFLTSVIHAGVFKKAASIVGTYEDNNNYSSALYQYIPWINLTRNTDSDGWVDDTTCVLVADK